MMEAASETFILTTTFQKTKTVAENNCENQYKPQWESAGSGIHQSIVHYAAQLKTLAMVIWATSYSNQSMFMGFLVEQHEGIKTKNIEKEMKLSCAPQQ